MTQCPYCGTQNTTGKFCAQCGATLVQMPPAPQPAPRSKAPLWIAVGVVAALLVVGAGAALFLSMGNKPAPSVATGGNTPSPAPAPSRSKLPSDPNNPLVGGFIHMRVPGAAYTQQSGDTMTLYVSSGTMTASSLLINPDGTYVWNSQWDGKLIRGTWVKTSDGLVLQKAQEGKDWIVSVSTPQHGGDILVYNESTWYIADRAKE